MQAYPHPPLMRVMGRQGGVGLWVGGGPAKQLAGMLSMYSVPARLVGPKYGLGESSEWT